MSNIYYLSIIISSSLLAMKTRQMSKKRYNLFSSMNACEARMCRCPARNLEKQRTVSKNCQWVSSTGQRIQVSCLPRQVNFKVRSHDGSHKGQTTLSSCSQSALTQSPCDCEVPPRVVRRLSSLADINILNLLAVAFLSVNC